MRVQHSSWIRTQLSSWKSVSFPSPPAVLRERPRTQLPLDATFKAASTFALAALAIASCADGLSPSFFLSIVTSLRDGALPYRQLPSTAAAHAYDRRYDPSCSTIPS